MGPRSSRTARKQLTAGTRRCCTASLADHRPETNTGGCGCGSGAGLDRRVRMTESGVLRVWIWRESGRARAEGDSGGTPTIWTSTDALIETGVSEESLRESVCVRGVSERLRVCVRGARARADTSQSGRARGPCATAAARASAPRSTATPHSPAHPDRCQRSRVAGCGSVGFRVARHPLASVPDSAHRSVSAADANHHRGMREHHRKQDCRTLSHGVSPHRAHDNLQAQASPHTPSRIASAPDSTADTLMHDCRKNLLKNSSRVSPRTARAIARSCDRDPAHVSLRQDKQTKKRR